MSRSLFILSLVALMALMAAVGYYYERRAWQAVEPAPEAVIGTALVPQDIPTQPPEQRKRSG